MPTLDHASLRDPNTSITRYLLSKLLQHSTSLPKDNSALFLWVVDSHLDQGIELMKRWGFDFKTIAFIWVKTCKSDPTKPRMGMGLWTRKQAEICIFGTRGKVPRRDKGVRQVIMAPRREHSRKPDEVYGRIERLVDGPYLEDVCEAIAPRLECPRRRSRQV